MLSRNRVKFLSSLKVRKFRTQYGQFLAEGEKIVLDLLNGQVHPAKSLIATRDWLAANQISTGPLLDLIEVASESDLRRITSLETPPPVVLLLNLRDHSIAWNEISKSLSLAFDEIKDPGNLGTIIRTADWFGIRYVICSSGSADCYNPKVVQSSMGAVMNVQVVYTDLGQFLSTARKDWGLKVLGTHTGARPVSETDWPGMGIVLFGNESRGISPGLFAHVDEWIAIPPASRQNPHVESLNVASSAAIVCAMLTKA